MFVVINNQIKFSTFFLYFSRGLHELIEQTGKLMDALEMEFSTLTHLNNIHKFSTQSSIVLNLSKESEQKINKPEYGAM